MYLLTFLVSLFLSNTAWAQKTVNFIDTRDGQTYKTISFDNALSGTTVTWMAQNLNFKMQGSYAYNDNESYRKALGLLYTWEAAKKACPSGWHLPTNTEWSMLISEFGDFDKAGEALKNNVGWNDNGNGTNSSGFSALPGGMRYRDGSYENRGESGNWWSSSLEPQINDSPWLWSMDYSWSMVETSNGFVSYGVSVRCVQD